ncbi:MAG: NlpC/P60 family protein [Bacilli bacterium]|nr:NlpC/P60 family protein [Bacilli bacterium]
MKNIKTRILEKLSIKKSIIPAICLVSFLSTGFVAAEKAAPVITLNSEEAVIIDYNSTFDYNNYMTFENTETINVYGDVDTQKEGTYQVSMEAINQYAQKTTKDLTVVVDDMSAPVITLTKDQVSLKYGSSFNAKKYIKSVTDNKDGNLKSAVKVSSKVNTKKSGTYTVTYSVEDQSGNKSNATLKVTVKQMSTRQKIVATAQSKLGCKYVWGAVGPKTFDCSGLVRYCYRQAGVSVPRSSGAQKSGGKVISISEAKPGDIVWRPGHVGIYVGNGQVIHAPRTGKNVSYTSAGSFKCAIRYVK